MTTCFGLFVGDATCNGCSMTQRCRSTLLNSGITVVSDALDDLIAALPDQTYRNTTRLPQLLDQILNPEVPEPPLTEQQKELLQSLGV